MALVKVKKRQSSKKNKKAWRKTDIQDVEDFLEDKRLEERLGAPFTDREDHELFTIDTAPDEKNLEKYEDLKKERRHAILSRAPRCFQVLQPDSKVPDPISKRNRIRTAEERKHPMLRLKEQKRLEKGIFKAKDLDRFQNRIVDKERRQNRPVRGDFGKDLWDEGTSLIPEISILKSEWLEPSAKKHILACLGSKQKSAVPKVSRKPHIIPAVEVPHPGMSYNPSYIDHLDLLQKIAETEQKLIKEEKHIKRVTTHMFKKLPQGESEAQWIKEMSEGVPVLDPEASKPDTDPTDDNEYHAINPPTNRDLKKDLKTRRKAREERAKQAERHLSKMEQKKISDIYRLKKLEAALTKAEEKSQKLKEKRLAIRARQATKTRRLGRNKFEEKEMDFNLASDLKGSLRALKPEGNLLADRFVSFQKRNIMEVAARQNPRSAKKKKFIKASHKMAWEVRPLHKQNHLKKKTQTTTVALGQK